MLVLDRAGEHDVSAVAQLAAELLPEAFGPEWFLTHLGDEFLVAREVESARVVGFCVADHSGPCEGHVEALAVDRHHRRQGVATALLRSVQEDLRRNGTLRLTLDVRHDDGRAKEFYQRHGFYPEGLQEHVYLDGAHAVRYARPL